MCARGAGITPGGVCACRWEAVLPAGRHLHCVRWGDLVGRRESNPGVAVGDPSRHPGASPAPRVAVTTR